MGFLDKIKETSQQAVAQGKEAAQHQQLKLHLKKLQSQRDEAATAFGTVAYDDWKAGMLSMQSEQLAPLAQAIADADEAIEAKRAEIGAVGNGAGAHHEDDRPAE